MDDLISRQAVIDKAIMIPVARIVTEDKVIWRKAVFVEDIEALPSAQPERKRGRWIERNPNNSPKCRLIECSECGNAYIVDIGLLLEDWAERRNFCVRCGADMRGEEV